MRNPHGSLLPWRLPCSGHLAWTRPAPCLVSSGPAHIPQRYPPWESSAEGIRTVGPAGSHGCGNRMEDVRLLRPTLTHILELVYHINRDLGTVGRPRGRGLEWKEYIGEGAKLGVEPHFFINFYFFYLYTTKIPNSIFKSFYSWPARYLFFCKGKQRRKRTRLV